MNLDVVAQPNRRLLMLTVNFETFETEALTHFHFLHCPPGQEVWKVDDVQKVDIVIIKCDSEGDLDIVRELRFANPRLPVIIMGPAERHNVAVKMRCAYLPTGSTTKAVDDAASSAFVLTAEC